MCKLTCFNRNCTYNTSFGGYAGSNECHGGESKCFNCDYRMLELPTVNALDEFYHKLAALKYEANHINDAYDAVDTIKELIDIMLNILEVVKEK